jgi:hypothetical protein
LDILENDFIAYIKGENLNEDKKNGMKNWISGYLKQKKIFYDEEFFYIVIFCFFLFWF